MKAYRDLEIIVEPVMKGQRIESLYVMSVEIVYVDKIRRNETIDLWHMRLGRVNYSKLDVMIQKLMLKGLQKLEVTIVTICAGYQYEKAH